MTTQDPSSSNDPLITHRFIVSVDVPAKSGDGWNQYPDYSSEEVGRMLRRALHDRLELELGAMVEYLDSRKVDQ